MAGNLNAQCSKTFKRFVEVSSSGKTLTEAEKREIRDKGMNKMLKECCSDAVAKASEAQVFPKYCDKKTKKLKLEVFLADFMLELAAAVIQNEKKLSKRPPLTDPEVEELANTIRGQIAAKCDFKPKEQKTDAVTARLMDTKGYTGTHRERFDEAGKGKGLQGRRDIVDESGYVTGFKGHKAEGGAGGAAACPP